MSTNYVYGTGRRKTAVARVRLLPGDGSIVHTIRTHPVSPENAPYFTALVASSWNAMPRAKAAFGGKRMFSPVT